MSKAGCWVLLPFLILSFFLVRIHGNKQLAQTVGNLYKSMLKTDMVPFEVPELDHDTMIQHSSQTGLKEKDRIERLPGQPNVNFSQYGGYVTINKSAGRAFYYYFVEAQPSNKTLPLLLWISGGPGCSSLGYGAMIEVGPFRVNSDGKTLHLNRYSWNYAANVLFLETPTGSGFSYSNSSSDYKQKAYGDKRAAVENYVFLVNWLERFNEYKNRDFYIAGESYSGHSVPQLAHTILYHNKKANKTLINLKGIMIGNPLINYLADMQGSYDFWSSHAIISYKTRQDINKFCNLSLKFDKQNSRCKTALYEVPDNLAAIDPYNIYAPLCKDSSLTSQPMESSTVVDPCSGDYVYVYLNRGDVQEALHANVTKLKYAWNNCANLVWGDIAATVIPNLLELLNHGLRVWIYSGDVDGIMPVTSTTYSINAMNLPIKTKWHPWFIFGEAGGYTQVYKGDLTFATVRGAGHQVPADQPGRALSLIKHFLDGTPLPNSKRV